MNNTLYIKSTAELRPFLELAGYGCYSRQQMKRRLKKAGTYDKRIEFLNACLPSTYWHYSRQGKERRFSFHGDSYHRRYNYLAPIFAMKSLDIQWLLCYLTILAVLNSPHVRQTGMPYSALEKKVVQALYDLLQSQLQQVPFFYQADWKKQLKKSKIDHKKTAALALQLYHESWNSQIRRRAKELDEAGLIASYHKGNKLWYQLVPSKLTLAPQEANQLTQTLFFIEGAAVLRLPGCYLSQSFAKPVLPYYQVHHSHLLGTINDPQIYFLLHAIQKGWPISFSYRGKFKEGYPLNVWIDAYKREYICLWETTKYTTYRIHRMHHLRRLSHSIKTVQKKEKAIPQIILRIYYESMPAFQDSIAKIHEYFPNAVATAETTHTALCPIQIQDGRSLVPWLRTLHPAIEVVSDSTGKLRHRLHHDFEEALAQYE